MAVALKPLIEMRPPAEPLLTMAHFDALPAGPPDYKFDGGRLIATPRPHPRHQKIIMRLAPVRDQHVTAQRLGNDWPEVDVQLSRRRVYVPDPIFLARSHQERYSPDHGRISGAHDLVVEIVSPASAGRDCVAKFNACRESGVPWCSSIDSQSPAASRRCGRSPIFVEDALRARQTRF